MEKQNMGGDNSTDIGATSTQLRFHLKTPFQISTLFTRIKQEAEGRLLLFAEK